MASSRRLQNSVPIKIIISQSTPPPPPIYRVRLVSSAGSSRLPTGVLPTPVVDDMPRRRATASPPGCFVYALTDVSGLNVTVLAHYLHLGPRGRRLVSPRTSDWYSQSPMELPSAVVMSVCEERCHLRVFAFSRGVEGYIRRPGFHHPLTCLRMRRFHIQLSFSMFGGPRAPAAGWRCRGLGQRWRSPTRKPSSQRQRSATASR